MGLIHITNFIAAPSERVYDLSRHILLQKNAMDKIGVKHVRGVSSGLVGDGEAVLWKVHFLKRDYWFTLKITSSTPGLVIREEMSDGPLESFIHQRHFKQIQNGTLVIDEVQYTLSGKLWSGWIDRLWLNGKLHALLKERNQIIKAYAESNKWSALLTK
jgi:ligand-binding SRPBCC domain-containing protein